MTSVFSSAKISEEVKANENIAEKRRKPRKKSTGGAARRKSGGWRRCVINAMYRRHLRLACILSTEEEMKSMKTVGGG